MRHLVRQSSIVFKLQESASKVTQSFGLFLFPCYGQWYGVTSGLQPPALILLLAPPWHVFASIYIHVRFIFSLCLNGFCESTAINKRCARLACCPASRKRFAWHWVCPESKPQIREARKKRKWKQSAAVID